MRVVHVSHARVRVRVHAGATLCRVGDFEWQRVRDFQVGMQISHSRMSRGFDSVWSYCSCRPESSSLANRCRRHVTPWRRHASTQKSDLCRLLFANFTVLNARVLYRQIHWQIDSRKQLVCVSTRSLRDYLLIDARFLVPPLEHEACKACDTREQDDRH